MRLFCLHVTSSLGAAHRLFLAGFTSLSVIFSRSQVNALKFLVTLGDISHRIPEMPLIAARKFLVALGGFSRRTPEMPLIAATFLNSSRLSLMLLSASRICNFKW